MNGAVVLVTENGMGKADKNLQQTLLAKYLELLLQSEHLPSAICFYTEGVKLVCKGSPVLKQLHVLESKNVRLIICSTCLDYFQLNENVEVGIVGGMGDILEAQMQADKVITL